MQWLAEHWLVIVTAASALATVLNVVTQHWSDAPPGVRRSLLVAVDLLSLLASRSAPNAGRPKLPLTRSDAPEKTR